MPEVKQEDLDLLKAAAVKAHETLEKIGKSIDPGFRADELFKREHPVEAIASAMKSVLNTADALAKRAGEMVEELKKTSELAEKVIRRGEMEKKGTMECPECGGNGMVKNADGEMVSCPKCHGEGEVAKAKGAKLGKAAVPAGAVIVERPRPNAARAQQRNESDDDDDEEFG